ncbi:unnamed protein product [Rhodiola kirilowii]
MEAPTLRLEMVQGPRVGEALEFKPGKKVGIGRLVRGNAIQIKDDGISSKHLCIEFDSGKWLVTDLDSSNGTILNDDALDPLVPTLLRDGDVVKIGECTSITVSFRVEYEAVVEEGNVRRNPRRRAAAAAKNAVAESVGLKRARVTERDGGLDLDEKKKLEGENDVESVADKRGRRGAAKKNNVDKVDDNRPVLQVVEASDVKVENVDQVVETGRRRGRPKKVNAVKGTSEAVESVLAGDEGLEAAGQAVMESRRGRGGRKGRAIKEKNGEDESAVAGLKIAEGITQEVEASRDERGGLRKGRAMNKKAMEDEVAMVDGKCDKPLKSVPSEDGIKKQTRAETIKARAVENEVVTETHEEIEIVNSESEMPGKLVNIKKEKVSLCPSIVPESLCLNSRGVVFENEKSLDGQAPVPAENEVSEMVKFETVMDSHEALDAGETLISEKTENMKRLGSCEPLEAADTHFAVDENTVTSESYKKKDINNSENEIHENLQNIKKEKLSTCPSTHEEIPETFYISSRESEFCNERNSECDELKATEDGIAEKAGDMAELESQEPLEVAAILSGITANAERIDSGTKASQGCPAEPGHHDSMSGRDSNVELEEMTLGEWFDYLEEYLPRQIHNATEDTISIMIEKSKRFQEYVSQQQKRKGKAS